MSDKKAKSQFTFKEYEEDLTFKSENITSTKESLAKGSIQLSSIKSINLPCPQQLSQPKNPSTQNEKIFQNNKMIQDLLNENKKQIQQMQGAEQTSKLQNHQQQRIQNENQMNKNKTDEKDSLNIGIQTDGDNGKGHLQMDNNAHNVLAYNQQGRNNNKNIFLSPNPQKKQSSVTASPLEYKRVPSKEVIVQKRTSIQNNMTPKISSQSVSYLQMSAKLKDYDLKLNVLPSNAGNTSTSTTNHNLTQTILSKTDDVYKIQPPQKFNSYRRINNGSDITSGQSLREIKSQEKSRHSFRITDKMNLTQRNSSINNQGNTSIINLKNQQNQQMTPQQHFLSSQLPSPSNTLDGISKIMQSYYPQLQIIDSNKALNKQNNSKQFLFKPSAINQEAIESGSILASSSSIQGQNSIPHSQNSQRPIQKTVKQLDLSQVTNQVGSQIDLQSTFRTIKQNYAGFYTSNSISNNIEIMTSKSKKFTQSFTQLTKIVNQSSPDKSPTNYANVFSQINNEKLMKNSQTDRMKVDTPLYEQYEASLKKEISSALSEGPSQRQDVIQMQKWLQNALNQISKMNSSKKIDHLSSVIELSFKELLRQISIECTERGELLQTVNYSFLYSLQINF